MAPRRRHALPKFAPDVTPEESHEEAPPQVGAMLVGGFDQFADALWNSFQQRFAQQHSEQSQQLPAAAGGDGGAASWAEKFMRFNLPQFKGSSTPEEAEFWV